MPGGGPRKGAAAALTDPISGFAQHAPQPLPTPPDQPSAFRRAGERTL